MTVPPFPWEAPDAVQGIDVSYAQHFSPAEWEAIRTAGVVSTSIKATDFTPAGRPIVDGMLDRHQAGALSVGQVVDYYAFLHSDLSGRLQAEHFARTIEKRPRMARWWCDFEDATRVAPDRRRAFECVMEFMSTGRRLLGEDGGIYTGNNVMLLLASLGSELDSFLAYDLWVAHYRIDPATGRDYGLLAPIVPKPWKSAIGWQVCGDKGPRIPGVGQDVDRDVFLLGGRAGFEAWRHKYDGREPPTTFPSTAVLPIGWQDRAEDEASGDD